MNPNADIYIQSIFREHGAFSLPGVGTFRKISRPTRLGEEGEWIMPPEVQATFEPGVISEILFSEQLIAQFALAREEAQALEAEVVSRIRQHLKKDQPYSLAGIGLLSLGTEGGIQFAPTDMMEGGLGEAFFGLKPVASPQPISPIPPPQESLIHSHMPSSPSAPRRARGIGWKTFLIILGLPILGIGLVKFGPVQIMSRQLAIQTPESGTLPRIDAVEMPLATAETPQPEEAAPTKEPTLSPAPIQESPLPPAEQPLPKQTETPAEVAPEPIESSPTARLAPNSRTRTRGLESTDAAEESTEKGNLTNLTVLDTARQEPKARNTESAVKSRLLEEIRKPYHLIISSFSSQASAREKVTELQNLGYNPVVIQSRKNGETLYRISIFRSSDRKEVETFSARLRARNAPAGWILDRRNN